MAIRHHLSDELLVDYEAGSLAEGWSLAVATHLALCPQCRARSRDAAAIGGMMFECIESVQPEADSFEKIMKRIGGEGRDAPQTTPRNPRPNPAVSGDILLPEPLRSYVGGDLDAVQWKNLGVGAQQMRLATGDGATNVRLLRIPAGDPVPMHTHRGQEMTVVLCGSLVDGEDVYMRGDVEYADQSVEHQPAAGPGEDCICLVVTDAPLRFSSKLMRMMQPFLRI
jgi:putative transcriptional regulator